MKVTRKHIMLFASLFLAASCSFAQVEDAELNALNKQAMFLCDEGEVDSAFVVAHRALEIAERNFGPHHPDVALILETLATMHHYQCQYAQADSLFARFLAIRQKLLGPEHADVAEDLNNIGGMYFEQGRFAEAESLFERSLAIKEKVVGPDHPDVAESLEALAKLHLLRRQFAPAEALLKRALLIREKTLAPDDPLLAMSLSRLAQLYDGWGRYAQAESLFDRSQAVNDNVAFVDRAYDAPLKLEMISLPGGTITVDSESGTEDESSVCSLTVNSFSMSKYEITNAQYCEFLNEAGISSSGHAGDTLYIALQYPSCQIAWRDNEFVAKSGRENYPVVEVTWFGARGYCVWAGGRLSAEVEWEYAARGGQHAHGYLYSGGNAADDVAWYVDNSANPHNPWVDGKGTHPVGQKLANELGLYDMSGNVFEWCDDSPVPSGSGAQNNLQGPSDGSIRILRGGSWSQSIDLLGVTSRAHGLATDSGYDIGFRLCR